MDPIIPVRHPHCVGPADCKEAHDAGPDDDCEDCPSYRGGGDERPLPAEAVRELALPSTRPTLLAGL